MTDRERLRLWKRFHRNLSAALDLSIPSPTRRRHARHAAHYGEKLGIVSRPSPEVCERCGTRTPLERHHTDYLSPLFISWLCPPCHDIADAEMHGERIDRDGGWAA